MKYGRLPLLHMTGLMLLASMFSVAQAEQQKVRVAEIKTQAIEHTVRTFGILAPNVEEMSFQIPGRIESFLVDEGDLVAAGDLLAQLETLDAEDAVQKATTNLENAARVLARMKTLHESGSIQISQLEDAQADFDQVKLALEQAETNLERCFLRAPSNGLILKKRIDSRTSVSPGQSLFVFQSDDEQWITKVDLTDRNALFMAEGATAEVFFSPYPNETFEGQVVKVAQVANAADRLYTAEIVIATGGRELRPGMVAEVDISKRSDKTYSVVPFDALLALRKNKGLIYVVSPDQSRVLERSVTIENINGQSVALVQDLSEFTEVVVRGHQNLKDQALIQIQN